MLNKLLSIFKKTSQPKDPLNGYTVGKGYELLISKQANSDDWSICQLCLEVVENCTQNVPDSYCCPECASEAVELPYMALQEYLVINSSASLQAQLHEWQQKENLVQSYKALKELRLNKLVELSNGT
jgi:hypothetical protein